MEPGKRTKIANNILVRNMDGIRYGPASANTNFDEGFISSSNQIEFNSRDGIRIDTSAWTGWLDSTVSQSDTIRRNGGAGVHVVTGSRLKNFDVMNGRMIENVGAAVRIDGAVDGGSIVGNRMRDLRSGAARLQTSAIIGSGAMSNIDIDGNQFAGPGAALALTGQQTNVGRVANAVEIPWRHAPGM